MSPDKDDIKSGYPDQVVQLGLTLEGFADLKDSDLLKGDYYQYCPDIDARLFPGLSELDPQDGLEDLGIISEPAQLPNCTETTVSRAIAFGPSSQKSSKTKQPMMDLSFLSFDQSNSPLPERIQLIQILKTNVPKPKAKSNSRFVTDASKILKSKKPNDEFPTIKFKLSPAHLNTLFRHTPGMQMRAAPSTHIRISLGNNRKAESTSRSDSSQQRPAS
jgi:hypothetical protein